MAAAITDLSKRAGFTAPLAAAMHESMRATLTAAYAVDGKRMFDKLEALAALWMQQQSEYPITEEGQVGAAVLRCCANELRVALTGLREATT